MSDLRYHRKRHFTDLAIVAGPTMRWAEDDYEDLCRAQPEVLLGYQVILTNYRELTLRLRGLNVSKLVLLDAGSEFLPRAIYAELEVLAARGTKLEQWRVRRDRDGILARRVA